MIDKYLNIKTISDIEVALKNENFIIDFSKEVLFILEKTIDPFDDNCYTYNVNQATIAGLLVKQFKYFNLILRAYINKEYDTNCLISRPLYEAFVIMKYLIRKGEESQRHYRLVSYKRRFKQMQDLKNIDGLGDVMLKKIDHALEIDGFSMEDLEGENMKQNGRKWELDGKTFFDIHKEVENTETYPYMYGMVSEVIHSGWGDIRQLHLTWCEGDFAVPNIEYYQNNDIRTIVPIVALMIEAIEEFLKWAERENENSIHSEHKRITTLLSEFIYNNYKENPEQYLTN
nr:DUF5677 domain-containing protein [uncultured Marinifilum sp.]